MVVVSVRATNLGLRVTGGAGAVLASGNFRIRAVLGASILLACHARNDHAPLYLLKV